MKGFITAVERLRDRTVELPSVDKRIGERFSSQDEFAGASAGAERMRLMRSASLELARELDR
jgi:hypothetical protein